MPRPLPCLAALAALALTAPLLLSACGGSGSSSAGAPASSAPGVTGDLTVLAAASLSGSFPTLGKQFQAAHPGTRVRFSFGASSTLAQQITSGAPADVFASASSRNMDQVLAAGAAAGPRTFARNQAEIAVSPRAAARVHALADLAAPGLKVALCQPEVPCGALGQKVLANAGVTVKPVTQGLDVKAVLTSVTSGEVDAGIVYVTDVKAAGSAVAGVPIPAGANASTAYPIATVTRSAHAVTAQAFEDYVLSPAGQQVLSAAGLTGP